MLEPQVERRQRTRNAAQSALLLGSLLAVAAGLGWLMFDMAGLLWMLLLTGFVVLGAPRIPPQAVLALYRAEAVPYAAAPELHRMLDELAARAGLHHPPALSYVPSAVPNAFCVGHGSEASLALTDGLLRRLTRREVAGVLAHEVSHLRAGDPAVMSLSDVIGRLCQVLGLAGLLTLPIGVVLAVGGEPRLLLLCAVLVPLPAVVTLLQLALCRSREFDADLAAVRLTGDPEGLARALEVLELTTGRIWERLLVGRGALPDPLLLRTHPATVERTRRLRALEPRDDDPWGVGPGPVSPRGYAHVDDAPRLRWPGIRW
jgi:heat shock protein HtpX